MLSKAILLYAIFIRCILCDLKCSDVEICPKNKPFCSKVGCVFECPQQFFINGTNCLTSCGHWYVKDRLCVEQCPDDWFEKDLLTLNNGREYMEKQCVEKCNSSEYISVNTCVEACPLTSRYINNRNCSSHCPSDKPLLLNFTIHSLIYFECVNTCPHYADGEYCIDECGEKLVHNSSCVEKCPEVLPFISEKRCVKNCPPKTVYINQSICQQNCSKETPFFINKICAKACPDTYYITNRNGVIFCEENCHAGEYRYKNTCVNSCAYNGIRDYNLFYFNDTCREKCPSDYLEQKQDYHPVGECVKSCDEERFVNNGSCVTKCPENTRIFNKTCLVTCPVNAPLTCLVGNDFKCTRSGPSAFENRHNLCVSKCPDDTLILNETCVAQCPVLYPVLGRECTRKCPEQYPLIQNKTVSYKKCRGWNCWDYTTENIIIPECVSTCSDAHFVFNSTCVLKCPPSHHYIDNRTCKSNGCSTPYQYNESAYITCTNACDGKYFVLNNTCVKECPENSYITDKTCHFDKCQTKYTYNTSSVMICTNECSEYGFLNDNSCVELCPKYVFNRSCVNFCPKDYNLLSNKTRTVQRADVKAVSYVECSNTCSDHMFLFDDFCLYKCPASYYAFEQTCVSRCPPSKPFHQNMTVENNITDEEGNQHYVNVCVKHCQSPSYLSDIMRSSCVSVCPNETNYIYRNVCTAACPKGKATSNVDQGVECVDYCPSKSVRFNGTCMPSCPKDTFNFNDTSCVLECPKSMPLGLRSENWRCINRCEESYETFKNGSCIYESDCKEPYFVFETSCILSCPHGYFWYTTCIKRWDRPETTVCAVIIGLWVVLLFWTRTALKEYLIVLSMIILKTDISDDEKKYESIGDAAETTDDRQHLLPHADELEEV